MAIGRFDDVLSMISDAQEREAIKKSLEKNPEALKAVTALDNLAKDGTSYNEWYKVKWPEEQQKLTAAQKELVAAQVRIKELETGRTTTTTTPAAGGTEVGDMTVEQIEERMMGRLKKEGFVTVAEANRIADEKATAAAAAAQGRVYTHGLPMVERMMAVQDKFNKDFGKQMDRAAFGKFIADNKYSDVDVAYEAFTRDQYLDKIKTDAFEQGKLAGTKETAERIGRENSDAVLRGLPSDMQGSHRFASQPGAPPEPVALKDIPANYQLGQRGGFKLANAIAAQIEADKAAGKTI